MLIFILKLSPILQQRCNDCHKAPYEENGRTKNPKAGLRFDTYEWLMKGSDDFKVVVAGSTEESILYEVITLPPDDDMIMPPKGDPLTADQIDLFRRWILEGATEKPSGKVVSSATAKTDSSNRKKKSEKKTVKFTELHPKKTNFPSWFFFRSCSCSTWRESRRSSCQNSRIQTQTR